MNPPRRESVRCDAKRLATNLVQERRAISDPSSPMCHDRDAIVVLWKKIACIDPHRVTFSFMFNSYLIHVRYIVIDFFSFHLAGLLHARPTLYLLH